MQRFWKLGAIFTAIGPSEDIMLDVRTGTVAGEDADDVVAMLIDQHDVGSEMTIDSGSYPACRHIVGIVTSSAALLPDSATLALRPFAPVRYRSRLMIADIDVRKRFTLSIDGTKADFKMPVTVSKTMRRTRPTMAGLDWAMFVPTANSLRKMTE